ncbi:MAG TPA: type I-E CRISPR-associated endonuclease Cas1e [Acidobacteriota bacterium]|nr:type I-E CRISPR-associated endonuclease Cas1e [Acidobacteriota bacterium]
MLKGRLGLEGGRVPHADRHGLMWLGRGNLTVESGTLRFITAGYGDLAAGDYAIPYQTVSCFVVQPGSTVSHDALRILARHGCGVVFAGNDGVRFYASLPAGPDASARARRQALVWADKDERIRLARRMYAWRLGEVVPHADLNTLRGIEGSRMKATYRRLAEQYGIVWKGRRYDRGRPQSADLANQAINHASSAVEGAALTAVAAAGAIPQLGFIHEDPGASFALDISDLFRDRILLPVAFGSARHIRKTKQGPVERVVRKRAGEIFRQEQVVTQMIDRIKDLLDDDRRNP